MDIMPSSWTGTGGELAQPYSILVSSLFCQQYSTTWISSHSMIIDHLNWSQNVKERGKSPGQPQSHQHRSGPGSREHCFFISLVWSQPSELRVEFVRSFPWGIRCLGPLLQVIVSMHASLPLCNLHGPSSAPPCLWTAILSTNMAESIILFCRFKKSDGMTWGLFQG